MFFFDTFFVANSNLFFFFLLDISGTDIPDILILTIKLLLDIIYKIKK